MRFFYMVAAYNEESQMHKVATEMQSVITRFPGSEVHVIDNASTDRTFEVAKKIQSTQGWFFAHSISTKGMGAAFRYGLNYLANKKLTENDWVVFAASDLPFGFSDLEQVANQSEKKAILYVGSKAHPKSILKRDFKRKLASFIFATTRKFLLGIKTQDTQGSLFLRGDQLALRKFIQSNDYFFAVELIYFAEKYGLVVEVPVHLQPEIRKSKVKLIKDGLLIIRQLLKFKQRVALASKADSRLGID